MNFIEINNNDTLEIITSRLQKKSPLLLYVINGEKIKIYDGRKIKNIFFDMRVATRNGLDRYYFHDDMYNKYCIFGKENRDIFIRETEEVKEEYSIELKEKSNSSLDNFHLFDQPIIDIVEEIVDKGKEVNVIEETKVEIPNNCKLVRIINQESNTVVEMIVADKPNHEMRNYEIEI